MPRPIKQRMVGPTPPATVYKPAGIPANQLQWLSLTLDEFEAVRLVDAMGLDQETVAGQMAVSRPTVTRILARGRSKIASALSGGMALVIEGGQVVQAPPVVGRRGMGRGMGMGRGRGGRGRGRGGMGFGN